MKWYSGRGSEFSCFGLGLVTAVILIGVRVII